MLDLPKNQSTDGYGPLKDAYDEIFRRYNGLAQNNADIPSDQQYKIQSMGIYCISHHEMPIDKISRWLGFIQGILYAHNLLDINEERDITRPLIHAAYKEMQKEIPQSIDLHQNLLDSWD